MSLLYRCQRGQSTLLSVVYEAMRDLTSISFSRDSSYFSTMSKNTTVVLAKLYSVSAPTLYSFSVSPSSRNALFPLLHPSNSCAAFPGILCEVGFLTTPLPMPKHAYCDTCSSSNVGNSSYACLLHWTTGSARRHLIHL